MIYDTDLVKKAYKSIIYVWIIAMSWALVFQKPWIALSITLGTLVGTGVLASYDWLIRRTFKPGAKEPARVLLKLSLIKFPLIGALLFFLVRWDRANLPAFCGGIVLVHFAIIAKMIGIRLVEQLKADKNRHSSPAISIHTKES